MVWWCIDMKIWYIIKRVNLVDNSGTIHHTYIATVKNLKMGDVIIMGVERTDVIERVEVAINSVIADMNEQMATEKHELSLSEKTDKEIFYVEY